MTRTAKRSREAVRVGDVYHRLTVLGQYEVREDGQAVFPCRCQCGSDVRVLFRNLGVNKSCGCLQRETAATRKRVLPDRNLTGRERMLWHQYKMLPADFDAMYDLQGGRCAICDASFAERPAHVDHDHKSGRVRALLCAFCNRGLGQFTDDPVLLQRAADYLARASAAQAQEGV